MNRPRAFLLWMLAIAAVFVFWVGVTLLAVSYFGQPTTAGQFGDTFGAIGALFTGLSLVGIVYALILERKDLQATLEEIRLQREVQQLSAEALERQIDMMQKQARVQALTTLIQTPLEIDASTFLDRYKPAARQTRDKFGDYLEELERLREDLE